MRRFASVDALRGLGVAAMLLVNDAGDWGHVHPWLEHAAWHGCTPADFIFPFFLFIVGVSLGLSLVPRVAAGVCAATLARQVVVRGVRIVLLGLALSAVAWLTIGGGHGYRVPGVLQRIGVCFTLGGLLALYVRGSWSQWAAISALLAGYAALLVLGGSLEPGASVVDRLDSWLLGPHAYVYDAVSGQARDPEGLLSTLPALASVLLGLRAADWLRSGRTLALAAAGVVAMAAGLAASVVLPLNKQLWTPSFVLWTGGAAMLALAAAHALIDVRGWPALGRSLGINAIAAYAGAWLAACMLDASGAQHLLYARLFAAPLAGYAPWVPSLAFAAAFTAVWWLATHAMARRGWRVVI